MQEVQLTACSRRQLPRTNQAEEGTSLGRNLSNLRFQNQDNAEKEKGKDQT